MIETIIVMFLIASQTTAWLLLRANHINIDLIQTLGTLTVGIGLSSIIIKTWTLRKIRIIVNILSLFLIVFSLYAYYNNDYLLTYLLGQILIIVIMTLTFQYEDGVFETFKDEINIRAYRSNTRYYSAWATFAGLPIGIYINNFDPLLGTNIYAILYAILKIIYPIMFLHYGFKETQYEIDKE